MHLSALFSRATLVLCVISLTSTVYVYLYPAFRGCSFPAPDHGPSVAPLRLLALGDPQLEGESSLPDADAPWFPALQNAWTKYSEEEVLKPAWEDVASTLWKLLSEDLVGILQAERKRLDLFGNDYYLAHVYRTVRWWTEPTHMVVLGDLLGSQWIDVPQFNARADRYFGRVFPGSERLPAREELDQDLESAIDWKRTVINLAGNHDIGYAGDFDTHRKERFEDRFAPLNYDLEFQLHGNNLVSAHTASFRGPRVHMIVLNSMNLDSPAFNKELQEETKTFLADMQAKVDSSEEQDAVVLLTHIPLHKEEGICVDGPMFEYFPEENGEGVSEQNHLSDQSSLAILDGLFKTDKGARPGIILNGHDHEGCNVVHGLGPARLKLAAEANVSSIGDWISTLYTPRSRHDPFTVREVTVRSMMGSYGGNAGLVSGWFNSVTGRWEFAYSPCMFHVQHVWWTVHIMDLISVGLVVLHIALKKRRAVVAAPVKLLPPAKKFL